MVASELGDGEACSAAIAGRCCASAAVGSEGKSKKWKCGAGRLTGARCGLCWRALARRGLSRQAAGDARRHAAVNFCNRSDYCSIDSVKTIGLTASLDSA